MTAKTSNLRLLFAAVCVVALTAAFSIRGDFSASQYLSGLAAVYSLVRLTKPQQKICGKNHVDSLPQKKGK